MARPDTKPPGELSDRQLRDRRRRAHQTIDRIDRMNPAEAVRDGVSVTLDQYAAAIQTANEAEEEIGRRDHRAFIERAPLVRQLCDAARKEPPAMKWLREAQRFSHPELNDERLVATRLTDDDAVELEALVKRKRKLVSEPETEPLNDAETARWEALLGKAAGDENLFERKRKEAAVKTKLDELKDQRKVASLPRQPQLAEPGAIQIPRFAFRWLVGDEARDGAWSLMDLGLLAALLGAFANDDPRLFVDGRFEGEGDDRALVVPGGVGARLHGQIAGSPIETDNSGHIRVRSALAVLQRNKWIAVEQTVAEMRIRLGERARKLND